MTAEPTPPWSLHWEEPGHQHASTVAARDYVDRLCAAIPLRPTDRVLDLYCGLGNFTLPMARRAREVVGVEGEAGLIGITAGDAHAFCGKQFHYLEC